MILQVKVKPGCKIDAVTPLLNGTFQIKIREVPEGGKANQYLIKYLSKVLDLPVSSIALIRGKTSSVKLLQIDAEEAAVYHQLRIATNA